MLLSEFLKLYEQLNDHLSGTPVIVDGSSLNIAGITAVARYGSHAILDENAEIRRRVAESRKVLLTKIEAGNSIYGVSTGYGGSADTRTSNHLALGNALFQMQHCGILPSIQHSDKNILPLSNPFHSLCMPESWVRAAILIRMNSLIRGHSGVRWDILEAMEDILREDIIPVVPLRGSISASGDLSPLSYVAGTLMGNPRINVFAGPSHQRQILPSNIALSECDLSPLQFQTKEHLGLLNGTAFSAAVSGLAMFEAIQLLLLTEVCTAMAAEALLASKGPFESFIHDEARPHPGQIESAEIINQLLKTSQLARDPITVGERRLHEDKGVLKQDRYPLRTAPQFIGPQLEDIRAALLSIHQELNSTTDNPLVDSATQTIHDTGNFQAMAVTNAMEKTRLSLHHLGKILFAQATELFNPDMNKGLPPSLAGGDPSTDYHCKGLDIGLAAYVSELGFLANPVSTHIQSAEMHNQAVNSLALISARATMTSLEILTMIVSTCIYSTCQAFDLRAMNQSIFEGFRQIISTSFRKHLRPVHPSFNDELLSVLISTFIESFSNSSKLDATDRIKASTKSISNVILQHAFQLPIEQQSITNSSLSSPRRTLLESLHGNLSNFQSHVESLSLDLQRSTRQRFVMTAHTTLPAAACLGASREMYLFVRQTLGIKMHGAENLGEFERGLNATESTIGDRVSLIYQAIKDGKMTSIIVKMLK